ncbi:hypothetical protein [Aestuariivita sp.]|jgi:hypothetical protein|uniref:hypothetical protein n=1 Tax=Aestuariivita sp. TaxID=1872407 RepID=UPI00216BE430|nr:hypothetical protein [Aestuariivita sp.]MCE8006834.1 hypothetical protein [Aestuariivita sp.]
MHFDPKNKEHKARLYRAVVAAAELTNERFDDFLQTPFNPPWALAPNYRRNLQRGDYSAIRAQMLYEFLQDHHFAAAHREAPDIFSHSPALRWREILDQRASTNTFKLVLVKRAFGVVERQSRLSAADTTIKLGQEFCLELISDMEGYALALQGQRDTWHVIEIGPNGELVVPIQAGKVLLPYAQDRRPDPLSENRDVGLHDFVIVTSAVETIPVTVDWLITWVNDVPCQLHRASVRIVE